MPDANVSTLHGGLPDETDNSQTGQAATPTTGLTPQAISQNSDDGSGWRAEFSESLKQNTSLEKFDSPEALAQSYIELESLRGRSMVIPDDESSVEAKQEFAQKLVDKVPSVMLKPDFDNAEQTEEFYSVLGRPEKAEGYAVPNIEGIDPADLDVEDTARFKQVAYDAGLTTDQYKKVVSTMATEVVNRQAAEHQVFIDDQTGLREEWGNALESRMRDAYQFVMATDPPPALLKQMEGGTMPAAMLRWMHTLSTQFSGGEQPQIRGQGNQGDGSLTPMEANEKMQAILNNKQHAFWDQTNNQHEAAKKHFVELQRAAGSHR